MNAELLRELKAALEMSRAELFEGPDAAQQFGVEKRSDPLEEARLDAERELAIRSMDMRFRRLREITAALRRIQERTFGICTCCGGRIGARRLAAVPWSALCLHCKQESEQACQSNAGALSPGP
jgi:DnaK suppressor protein